MNQPQFTIVKKTAETGGMALTVLIAYFFFEYVRPQSSVTSIIGYFKIPMLLWISLALIVLMRKKSALSDKRIILMTIFVGFLAVSVLFATNNFSAYKVTKGMMLTLVSCYAIVVIIQDKESLKKFINSWVIINIIVALVIIRNGGTGPGGFLADENDAALLMVMALPFSWYMAQQLDISKKRKYFYWAGCILISVAVMATASRGGLVGYVAVVGMMFLWSAKPAKNIFMALAFGLLFGGIAISFLPKEYVSDMETISDTEGGTAGLRLLHWTAASIMFTEHPILGVGAGNYPWNSQDYLHRSPYFKEGARGRAGRQAHSLYFTLIPETGLVGIIILFFFLLVCYSQGITIRRAGTRKNKNKASPFIKLSITSLLCSLVGYLSAGAFVSVLYYPVFWHLVALSVVISNVHQKYQCEEQKQFISR